MTVLITGGLGNLGSWLTGHLLGCGFTVTTFSPKNRPVLQDQTFERLFGQIENEDDLEKLFSNRSWDVIIHLASVNESGYPDYFRKAFAVNTVGTRNLLQALAKKGPTATHFIYFSTFHVYGLNAGVLEEDKTLPAPKNDYAGSHLFAEYIVKQYHHSHRIPFTVFRLTNGYGCPKEIGGSKWYLILNDLARTAVETKTIKLSSNGEPRRDFVWMGDVCSVVENCIRKGPANDTFNLGSGRSTRMLQIAEVVKKAYEDFFSERISIEKNAADTNRYEDFPFVSTDKLQRWTPFEAKNRLYEETVAIFNLLLDRSQS